MNSQDLSPTAKPLPTKNDIPSFLFDTDDDFVENLQTEDDINELVQPKYAESDEILATMDDTAQHSSGSESIYIEEILDVQRSSAPSFAAFLTMKKGCHLSSTKTKASFAQVTATSL